MSLTSNQISHALSRKLLRGRHTRTMMDYYTEKLPRLETPESPAQWKRLTARVRRDLLNKVFLTGLDPDVNDRPPEGPLAGRPGRQRLPHPETPLRRVSGHADPSAAYTSLRI